MSTKVDTDLWEVFIVYYEPTNQWEAVVESREKAEKIVAEKGDGYKFATGFMKLAPHSVDVD